MTFRRSTTLPMSQGLRASKRRQMAATSLTIALLPIAFLLGAVSTGNPILAIGAVGAGIVALIAGTRFHPVYSAQPASIVQPDLIVLLLPIVVASRSFSARASLIMVALLAAAAFMRNTDVRFRLRVGPFVLLIAASLVVFSRPTYISSVLTFLLVAALVVRIVMTVDARRIIVSLIDGCGLYLVANVVCHFAGVHSPAAADRIGGLAESTGFVRTVYPLTSSLNTPPAIAAIYLAAVSFFILESGWLRRSLRVICLIAAIIVLIGAGARMPLVIAAGLTVTVLCLPFITRWIAQGAVLLATVSAFVLPSISTFIQSAVNPLISLALNRDAQTDPSDALNGRDFIWARSVDYWFDRVNDLPHMLLGFGVDGPYLSGASLTYSERFSTVIRTPALASMHNSFLQQLFDGGILGWILLIGAMYWASARLARHRRMWGNAGLSAIVAMTGLILSGITEISLVPGATHETFWLLMVLVGVACQATDAAQKGHTADARREPAATPASETTSELMR